MRCNIFRHPTPVRESQTEESIWEIVHRSDCSFHELGIAPNLRDEGTRFVVVVKDTTVILIDDAK
jgi:hypothetical protein